MSDSDQPDETDMTADDIAEAWDTGEPVELTSAKERIQELEATADAQDAALKDMRKERDHWRDHRLSDTEAQALSECVKALDRFRESSRTGTTGYGPSTYNTASTVTYTGTCQVERVLRYLADRYGVTWYTPPAPTAPEVDAGELARSVVAEIEHTARLRP